MKSFSRKIVALAIAVLFSASTLATSVSLANGTTAEVSFEAGSPYENVNWSANVLYNADLHYHPTDSDSANLTTDMVEDPNDKGAVTDFDNTAGSGDIVGSGGDPGQSSPGETDDRTDTEDNADKTNSYARNYSARYTGTTLPQLFNAIIFDTDNRIDGTDFTEEIDSYIHLQLDADIALFQPVNVVYEDTVKLMVAIDKNVVNNGDCFSVNTRFNHVQNSNTAVLKYTYYSAKYDFTGFNPADGVTVLDIQFNKDGVAEVTVMVQDYNTQNYGDAMFLAKADVDLGKMSNNIAVDVFYVVKDADGNKYIAHAQGSANFVSNEYGYVPGDSTGKGYVDLIDLSYIIDMFGVDSTDLVWNILHIYFDFNDNGMIDIHDVVFVAQKVVFL